MVRNTTGGKHSKGQKNALDVGKELVYCQEGQKYAIVTKMLGDRRIMTRDEERERLAIIPKKFSSNVYWASPGSLVLLNIRDYQDTKADIAYIYNASEKKRLEKIGELDQLLSIDRSTQIDGDLVEEEQVTFAEEDD